MAILNWGKLVVTIPLMTDTILPFAELASMTNKVNAQGIQAFDFSSLICVGKFNCNSDKSTDNSFTITQTCESGNNIDSSPSVITNTFNFPSGDSNTNLPFPPQR